MMISVMALCLSLLILTSNNMLDLQIRLRDSCLSSINGQVEEEEFTQDKGSVLIVSPLPRTSPTPLSTPHRKTSC